MKVVFTDIDGVYNTPALRAVAKWAIEVDLVTAVAKTALKHDAKVVISSSWRVNMEESAKLLGFPLHDDWKTGDREDRNRGLEIGEWLSRHPEVEKYAIIDDHNDFLQAQQGVMVWTCTEQGITEKLLEKLDQLLA